MEYRHFSKALLLAFIASCASFSTPYVHANMAIRGTAGVSPNGAATYSIPIQLPPGTAGIEPKLSLDFNSHADNGLLGIGWSLGGMSAITRCAQTHAQDGTRGGVNYDVNDRFCLDGQRLVAVSGPYGGDGTEYRTELESFSKIISYGGTDGPDRFTVWTKSGQLMEYGHTPDAKVQATVKTAVVAVWALNRMQDTSGNYLQITYAGGSTGNYYPRRIDYTGNQNTGQAPDNYIEFVTEGRSDDTARGGIANTVRLNSVKAYIGGILDKSYTLQYEYGPLTHRSRLVLIRECGRANCLPLTRFAWSNDTPVPQNLSHINGHTVDDRWDLVDLFGDGRDVYWTQTGNQHYVSRFNADGTAQNFAFTGHNVGTDIWGTPSWRFVDLFGDGKKVYWTQSGTTHYVTRFNQDGTAQNWTYTGHKGQTNWRIADLFGDGRQVFWTQGPSSAHYITRMNPDGTVENWSYLNGHSQDRYWEVADLFGDGKPVYWTSIGTSHYVTRFNPDGTVKNWSFQGPHSVGTTGWQFVDLFGDGKKAFWTQSGSTHYVTQFNEDGTFKNWTFTGHSANAVWQFADMFGDGRQVFWTQSGSTHYVTQLNPDGTVQNWTFTGGHSPDERWQLVDLFGDGRQVYWTNTGDQHYVTRLNPTGIVQNWSFTGQSPLDRLKFGDVFGEGRQVYWTQSGNHFVSRFISNHPDQMLEISSGIGATTQFSYKPLTDASVYAKYGDQANPTAYPMQDVQVPLYVVSSFSTPDGIGGMLTTNYKYAGLRADLRGRGLLGFGRVESAQLQAGVTATTWFRQDWPYIGMPSLMTKSVQGSGASFQLRASANYACLNPADETICVIGAGKRYFPYLESKTEQSWDINGLELPSITTSSKYDGWGNRKESVVSASDGFSQATVNTYAPVDTANWFLDRLVRTTVTSTAP
jgi:hypothetical protein